MFLYMFTLAVHIMCVKARLFSDNNGAQIVCKWTNLDYEWQNEKDRQNAIHNSSFIVENNIITGIKVFQRRTYVTVPRWRLGVPSTLNEVVSNKHDECILKPFPNWSMQKLGNCNAFQYVQSMEIDPNTGYMWIIDTGINKASTSGGTSNCNGKIVIYDITSGTIVRKHTFPKNVVSKSRNFLNDLVLDYVDGKAKFAYISDAGTGDPKIVVYDFFENKSYFFQHKSMYPLNGYSDITVGTLTWNTSTPIDGIAMSPDFKFVYYCALADVHLYRIPTDILRNKGDFSSAVQFVGQKNSLSDGMIFSQKSLYFGGIGKRMVYKHVYQMQLNVTSFEHEQRPIFTRKLKSLEWIDGFSIDEEGNLWFVANSLFRFFLNKMNFENTNNTNMHIWKVDIGEANYLWKANRRTAYSNHGSTQQNWSFCVYVLLALFYILLL